MTWFFGKKDDDRPSKKEIQQIQADKLFIVEESPSNIVDISKIYLNEIPSSILSNIKYQHKECLLLNNNEFKDLKGDMKLLEDLQRLDLSYNLFRTVPKSISVLRGLTNLNLDNNQLTMLPATLAALSNIEVLTARNNQITAIAPEMGCLSKLTTLNLSGNQLTRLPDNFAHCISLTYLEVDLDKWEYPTADVIQKGGRETVIWLCKENNVDTRFVSSDTTSSPSTTMSEYDEECKRSDPQVEELVAKQIAERAAQDEALVKSFKAEEESYGKKAANDAKKIDKQKYNLKEKMLAEDKFTDEKLAEYIVEESKIRQRHLDAAMDEMDEFGVDVERILQMIDQMKVEEEARLKQLIDEDNKMLIKYIEDNELNYQNLQQGMKAMLDEDHLMDAFVRANERQLLQMSQDVAEMDLRENNNALSLSLELDKHKDEVIQMILKDEKLQMEMYLTAQQHQDSVYQALSSQINNVQENLYLLSSLEQKHQEQDKATLDHLYQQRAEMTALLVKLLHQQTSRQDEIKETLKKMEEQNDSDMVNFWLYQYQILMDAKPAQLIKEEEKRRAEYEKAEAKRLVLEGNMTEKEKEGDAYPTPAVLPLAWDSSGPSAPPTNSPTTKPPMKRNDTITELVAEVGGDNECCICLENPPNVVFVPCGHVCCCVECGVVSVCPMCRAEIQSTVRLFYTQTN